MDLARSEVRMKERLTEPLTQVKDDLRVFHKRANKYLNEKRYATRSANDARRAHLLGSLAGASKLISLCVRARVLY